ncbi:L-fucose:H+ symporter permease [Pelagicoccus enzymogenes]|uniref:L-fucose:H+ symporter permease n=1 Tax=Pelagicoccus enzymogenes TaxID=2773457 RepID=UPI00280EC8E2|nr:L-fucose:H+ symporter permease [Pelagicoccus enzymogenes]MDQ8197090.1 L-fucose:H+ symporter permease [Pelagicoccus enzymogenes]
MKQDSPELGASSLSDRVIQPRYLYPFILVTSLFALWGFANDITNPMVAAFKNVLLLSNTESSLVQSAFYGGYCFMAIPAAIFIKRFSYKSGILMGLALYVSGCFLFVPASGMQQFAPFLLAYFIMTCGLSFLETTANPYVLSMGTEATATRRLNLAQAFNPMGSIAGMFVAKEFILARLDTASEEERRALVDTDVAQFDAIAKSDLAVITGPYIVLGIVVAVVFLVFAFTKFPHTTTPGRQPLDLGGTFGRLMKRPVYVWGVVAQAFYVGAQIMCWTFIIQYAGATLGMSKADAQGYNIVAMVIFVSSRFICTFVLKYFRPGQLLCFLAVGGGALTLGVIFLPGMVGLWCLVGVSACMSLMFPTIYGLALDGLGDDAKLASAGLILAIGGGCLMPPLQAMIIDQEQVLGLIGVRASFALPLLCFVVIAAYGFFSNRAARVS